MKILVKDILAVPAELDWTEPVGELNALLGEGRGDYEFAPPLAVHLSHSRAGLDLFFAGRVEGRATASCARCLDRFPLVLAKDFSLVLTPEAQLEGEIALAPADLAQSFYSGPEVDMTPLVHEQVLLALPTRPLCAEECRGLCPQCGVNRNTGACQCTVETGDPRLAVLRTLKVDRGA